MSESKFVLLQIPVHPGDEQAYLQRPECFVIKGPFPDDTKWQKIRRRYDVVHLLDPNALQFEAISMIGPRGIFTDANGTFPLGMGNYIRMPYVGNSATAIVAEAKPWMAKHTSKDAAFDRPGPMVYVLRDAITSGVRKVDVWEDLGDNGCADLVCAAVIRYVVGSGDSAMRNYILASDGKIFLIDCEKDIGSGAMADNLFDAIFIKVKQDLALPIKKAMSDASGIVWTRLVAFFKEKHPFLTPEELCRKSILAKFLDDNQIASTATAPKKRKSSDASGKATPDKVARGDETVSGDRLVIKPLHRGRDAGSVSLLDEYPTFALGPDQLSMLPSAPEETLGLFIVASLSQWLVCFARSKKVAFSPTSLETSIYTFLFEELSAQALVDVGPPVMRCLADIRRISILAGAATPVAEERVTAKLVEIYNRFAGALKTREISMWSTAACIPSLCTVTHPFAAVAATLDRRLEKAGGPSRAIFLAQDPPSFMIPIWSVYTSGNAHRWLTFAAALIRTSGVTAAPVSVTAVTAAPITNIPSTLPFDIDSLFTISGDRPVVSVMHRQVGTTIKSKNGVIFTEDVCKSIMQKAPRIGDIVHCTTAKIGTLTDCVNVDVPDHYLDKHVRGGSGGFGKFFRSGMRSRVTGEETQLATADADTLSLYDFTFRRYFACLAHNAEPCGANVRNLIKAGRIV